MTDADFDRLPRFDARDFEPPAWATSDTFAWGTKKNGESSKSGTAKSSSQQPSDGSKTATDHVDEDEDAEEGDDVWEDASEGRSVIDLKETILSTAELRDALEIAKTLKTKGNAQFTSKPPDHTNAILSYQAALDILPPCPRKENDKGKGKAPAPKLESGSGIEEVTEEEAAAIEEEAKAKEEEVEPEVSEREEVEEEIRECTKACYGNLAACYLAERKYKEAADACTPALKIDPLYVKALQRRATANEQIGSWSSLTTAQDDYNLLVKLLPASSTVRTAARRALLTLPDRIRIQQEKEKDEMLGKLKELGNGLLGKFGLSTDMFKFDQQEGGGYNMRFER